jgi:hypothetical protein
MSAGDPRPDVNKQEILEALPLEVNRIAVTTKEGDVKYRKIEEVELDDVLMFNKNDQPVVMRGKTGRPSDLPSLELPSLQDTSNYVPVPNRIQKKKDLVQSATPQPTALNYQNDEVMTQVRNDPESLDVLHSVMMGLAEEAAAMAQARVSLESQGKNTSNVSAKRVTALRAIGDTWMKRKEQLGGKGIDLDGLAFKRVFGFIMETFRKSLTQASIRPEQIEVIFAKLANMMGDDWVTEAKKRADGDD